VAWLDNIEEEADAGKDGVEVSDMVGRAGGLGDRVLLSAGPAGLAKLSI